MEKIVLAYSDKYLSYNFGPWHPPFKPYREQRLMELLREHGLLGNYVDPVEPESATDEELMLVHTMDYIKFVKRASEEGTGIWITGIRRPLRAFMKRPPLGLAEHYSLPS